MTKVSRHLCNLGQVGLSILHDIRVQVEAGETGDLETLNITLHGSGDHEVLFVSLNLHLDIADLLLVQVDFDVVNLLSPSAMCGATSLDAGLGRADAKELESLNPGCQQCLAGELDVSLLIAEVGVESAKFGV